MAGASELRAWLLSDGAAGHESQSQGILDALSARRPLAVTRVPVTVRSPWARRLGRLLLRLRLPVPRLLLTRGFAISLPPGELPQLVVSSGGNTLLANALLARRLRVVSVYSGTLKGYPGDAVDLLVSVTPQPARNNLQLPLPPVPAAVSEVATLPPGKHLVMLIGGANREYPYGDADWQALVDGMVALSRASGRRWLVTTSRRSGDTVERLLADRLPRECIADCVLWGREPRRVMRDYLTRAAQVYVTEDSLTMVAEAIWSGRPVTSVGLPGAQPSANDAAALEGYVAAGLLRRTTCGALAGLAPQWQAAALPPVRERIADAVEALLARRAG